MSFNHDPHGYLIVVFIHHFTVLNSDLTQVKSDLTVHLVNSGTVNLNNYTESGVYQFTGDATITNIPAGTNGWLVVYSGAVTTTTKQIWYRWGTNNTNDFETYVRTRNENSWSNWTQYITTNELSSFITTKSFNQDNVTVASNDSATFSFSVSNSGYTPIGVIGYHIANGSSSGQLSSYAMLYDCYLSGSTVYLRVRNTWSGDAAKLSITVYVLYTKNI